MPLLVPFFHIYHSDGYNSYQQFESNGTVINSIQRFKCSLMLKGDVIHGASLRRYSYMQPSISTFCSRVKVGPVSPPAHRLPKSLSRCLSVCCWYFLSWTCWFRASMSRPITRRRVLKILALRAFSADLRLSTAFSMDWSTGKSTLYIFTVSWREETQRKYCICA